MKIDNIELFLVRFPLIKPYTMADKQLKHFDTVLLRMESGGISGWGEVFPGNEPTLTAAWSPAVFECVRECLIPRIINVPDIENPEHLIQFISDVKGNRHAKALLDLAWWDLTAKIQKQPLHQFFGGRHDKEIELGLSFDRFETPEEFLAEIRRAVDDGFKRITLKIRPGWDLQVLSAVRSEHPTLMVQCDVEGSLSLDRHSETLYRFDDFMPALLEQPLSSSEFVGHAMLQDSMRTPIALDESITTLHQAEIAVDLRSASAFCLKPGKTGGLTEAKTIHDLAKTGDVECYAGADIMTSIGYRFVAALASLPGFSKPADYVRFEEYLQHDPGVPLQPVLKPVPQPPPVAARYEKEIHTDENGSVISEQVFVSSPNMQDDDQRLVLELWSEPGIGFEPDKEMIQKFAVRKYEHH